MVYLHYLGKGNKIDFVGYLGYIWELKMEGAGGDRDCIKGGNVGR